MEKYPYTNLQNVNLDWVLEVVADFQSKYTDFGQTVTDALQAIEDAKNGSLETLANALAAATVTLENAKLSAINDLQTEKASILDEMQQTLTAALQAVDAERDLGVARLEELIDSFPLNDAQIIGQLQIINSILNGTDALAIQWQQGRYAYVDQDQQYEWVTGPNAVSSLMQAGCAGRKLHVKANTAGHLITFIYYWSGDWQTTSPTTRAVNAAETTFTFPGTATYFSVLLGTDQYNTTPISLSDVTATAEWIVDGIVQDADFEPVKEKAETAYAATANQYTPTTWEQGGFYADGSSVNSTTTIRNTALQDLSDIDRITCNDGYFFVVYAWENDTYVGMYNNGVFSTATYSRNTSVNMRDIVAAHPTYKYRLALRNNTTTTAIVPAEGSNVQFTIINNLHYIKPIDGQDMTQIITDALTNYGAVELAAGTYIVNNIIMPDYSIIKGQGRATILKVTNYHTHGITAGIGCTIENLQINGLLAGVNIPTSKGDAAGIAIISDGVADHNKFCTKISNVTIWGFNLAGIYSYKTGYWCANSVSADNCEMRYCYAGIFCDTNAEYGRYTNILVYGCYFGALVNGGNNKFVNCDFTDNRGAGFYLNANAADTVNDGHGCCVGCTFNHTNNNTGNAIIANKITNGYLFVGCQFHYGRLYCENNKGLVFNGCAFGEDLYITSYSNTAFLFSGCTFKEVNTITGNTNPIFVNCYTLEGLPVT